MVIFGDTIRLTADFENFAGVAADPTSVICKVYDGIGTLIVSAATSDTPATESAVTGTWTYDYTTTGYGVHYYEIYGSLEGHTIKSRGAFYVVWA